MSHGQNGGIELKPLRPVTSNILDIYGALRQQEKEQQTREKLLKVFAADVTDDMKFSHSIQVGRPPLLACYAYSHSMSSSTRCRIGVTTTLHTAISRSCQSWPVYDQQRRLT